MIIDRYLKDYKCEIQMGPDGKPREVYVYAGPLFESSETKEEHKKNVIILTALSILAVALYILGLFFDSAPAHNWYAVVPYSLNFLTYVFFVYSVISYMPIRKTYNRRQRGNSFGKFSPVGLIGALLSFTSVVGTIVCLAKAGNTAFSDWLFLGSAVIQTLVFAYLFIFGLKILKKVNNLPNA